MAGGFIFLAPFAVGAITVYVAWKEKPRSWKYCIVAPLFATVLMVLGSMIIMIEGLICAILIVPLFGMMGSFGGLAMGAVCRFTDKRKHVVYSVAVAPFLAATLTGGAVDGNRHAMEERTVTVDATAERVWEVLHNMTNIRADHWSRWMYRIGVPLPKPASRTSP